MKRLLQFCALLIVCAISAKAESTMTFIAGDDVCTPITVTVGGSSYQVTSSITIPERSGIVRATDCRGYKLRYDYGHRHVSNDESHDTYTFHETYDPNRQSDNSSHYGTPTTPSQSSTMTFGRDPRWGEAGRYLSQDATRHAQNVVGKAYPGLHLFTGISKAYGEFARLRVNVTALNFYVGIGKDWLFDGINKDKLLWHAGIGGLYHFGGKDPWGDIGGVVTVAKTSA